MINNIEIYLNINLFSKVKKVLQDQTSDFFRIPLLLYDFFILINNFRIAVTINILITIQ